MKTLIRSLGTAIPDLEITQAEAFEFLCGHFKMEAAERDFYRRLLLNGPIQSRRFAADTKEELTHLSQDALIERFARHARPLAAQAARQALAGAGVASQEIGGVVVNTCTGYLCPGLTSTLIEDLALPDDVRVADLMGMGCGGALPNLETACGMLARDPSRPVLCVAVEVCSATLFMGPDPGLIVSNSIFADGAAALVLQAVTDDTSISGAIRLVDFASISHPRHREKLRYRWEQGRLRNVLTRYVPAIGARAASQVSTRLLERAGRSRADIAHWIIHPGGTEVLDAVGRRMDLSAEALEPSRRVFAEYGNMSSASVLFALKSLMDGGRVQSGQVGVMISFGAGFTTHAVMLEFC